MLDHDPFAQAIVDVDRVNARLLEPAQEAIVELHALAQERNPVASSDEHVTRKYGVCRDPVNRDQAHIQ